jgi:hypothetical protein
MSSHRRQNGVESDRISNRPGDAETPRAWHQEVSPDAIATLQLAARIQREAVKNKAYRAFPLGSEVRRFLQAKRIERSVRPATIDSYESVLAKFAFRHADLESLEPFSHPQEGPALIIEFLDHHWGDADEATMKHRMSVLGSFFEWAYRTDRITANPMGRVQRPRRRKLGATRPRIPEPHVARLVSAAPTLRDQAGILLLGRLALRRNDLGNSSCPISTWDGTRFTCATRRAGRSTSYRWHFPTFGNCSTCTYRSGGTAGRVPDLPEVAPHPPDEPGGNRQLVSAVRDSGGTSRVHDAPATPRGD